MVATTKSDQRSHSSQRAACLSSTPKIPRVVSIWPVERFRRIFREPFIRRGPVVELFRLMMDV